MHEPGVCIVTLRGDIEEQTAPVVLAEALTALNDCPDGARHIVIDVSGVTFLDSTGLGALIQIRNAGIARDAAVSLRGVTQRIGQLLRVTGSTRFSGLTRCPTREDGPVKTGGRRDRPHYVIPNRFIIRHGQQPVSANGRSRPLLCRRPVRCRS